MVEINLLPTEERTQEQFLLLSKRLSIVSIVLLVFTAIFTLATLAFFTSLVSKRSDLITGVEENSARLDELKANEELITVIQEKASAADKILSVRTNHVDIFNGLSELIPQGVYFTDIKFSSDKASISGKARSYADVAGLTSSFLSDAGRKIFSAVSVDSLSSDESGVFVFAITAELASSTK
jgi:Tfp pilus assembly protein PilN